jgi:glycosyltransferase involved in cell wall biosynthesis
MNGGCGSGGENCSFPNRCARVVFCGGNSGSLVHSTALVYLDAIGVPSEVSFLKRFYAGFDRLAPTWVGWHLERDADALPFEKITLGRGGVAGFYDRLLFKSVGAIPPAPDLAPLKPRIVHAHFGRGGALALPLAQKLGVPLVVTFHGGDATKEKHYRRGAVPKIYQRRLHALQAYASGFHCVSGYIRDALRARGFPEEKLFVLHTGVEPAPVITQLPSHAAPYVLFVGRLVEKKGVAHLIDAVGVLQQRGRPVPLIIIGDGPLAQPLRQRAAGLPVTFLGWQPNAEVRRWMAGAMAVCVPSQRAGTGDSEGLGHVVLEAMAAGVPVVASRHGGISEIVADGETGLLVPPGDPGALADAVDKLVGNASLRQAMGTAGLATVQRRFDARTQSHALEDRLLAYIGA